MSRTDTGDTGRRRGEGRGGEERDEVMEEGRSQEEELHLKRELLLKLYQKKPFPLKVGRVGYGKMEG